MKNSKLFKLSLTLILAMGMVFTSCKKDEPDPEPNQHNDAFADVFIKNIIPGPGAPSLYGVTLYAGGEGLTSCTVTGPSGAEFTLGEYWKGAGNLRKHPSMLPADGEMTTTIPPTGNYVFTLTFDDGETKEIIDELTDVVTNSMLPIAGMTSYDSDTNTISASWGAIENIDAYMLKLTDADKNASKPLFVNIMPNTMTSYEFDSATSDANPGWLQSPPNDGDEAYVFLVGVKYEAGAEGATKENNKQMVTASAKYIEIW